MKKLIWAVLFASATLSQADISVGPWTPIFKGVDLALATNFPSTTVTNNGVVFDDNNLQAVRCVRVDLTDPGVQLFTTPRASNYVAEFTETLSSSISNFVVKYGVQVASDANFYTSASGGTDPGTEGVACEVYGLLISTGRVVSAADNNGGGRYASLLFTTNKVPSINWNNVPPGASTAGIYTAITGYYPVLTNGVNVWALYYPDFFNTYPDPSIHDPQPRTVFGLSQNKRYLFVMTIDGRQFFSYGALDQESAMWMLLFGAWDAINMDGGGSTALYMADCAGNPVALNHSSSLASLGRERFVGAHFGIYAQPLPAFINNIGSIPAETTAGITWSTVAPANSQVEYGTNTSYGTLSPLDPTKTTNHSVTLTGLKPGTRYYYQVLSSDGTTPYSSPCGAPFVTTNNQPVTMVFDITNAWKFSTANLDGVNWTAPAYNDSGWTSGPGLLWADSRGPNPNVNPENTQMPLNPANNGYPFITYYFRKHFTYTNSLAGVTLLFSNYIDDGAVFYLNGVEINRLYLPTPAFNATLAVATNCSGDATCPYVFTVAGDLITNLNSGDNVVAVEVHNAKFNSPDVTFGQALLFVAPPPPAPPFIQNLKVIPGETNVTVTWTTVSNAMSRVAYALTTNINKATPLDTNLVLSHSVTVTGLMQLTNYYFQAISRWTNNMQFTSNGTFSTVQFYVDLIPPTNTWAYTTNNENAVNWTARSYNDSLFLGQGPPLLYVETNSAVSPRNTPLPAAGAGAPFPTYYFRTHFPFNTNLPGFSLVFTNYVDDGAIFYLNGTEIQRLRMPAPPAPINYTTLATGCPHPVDCDAVTNAPDIFRISGDQLTNLVAGADNVLAVEVHQTNPSGSDVVFGSSMGLVRALVSETKLRIAGSLGISTISWDGSSFTLQQATVLGPTNSWNDVPGPITSSPYSVTNPPASVFYRLRN